MQFQKGNTHGHRLVAECGAFNHLIEIRLASPMQPGNPLGNQYCVSLHLGSKFGMPLQCPTRGVHRVTRALATHVAVNPGVLKIYNERHKLIEGGSHALDVVDAIECGLATHVSKEHGQWKRAGRRRKCLELKERSAERAITVALVVHYFIEVH